MISCFLISKIGMRLVLKKEEILLMITFKSKRMISAFFHTFFVSQMLMRDFFENDIL